MSNKKRLRKASSGIRLDAPGFQASLIDASELSIVKEIDYIIRCAQEGDARIVSVRGLLLFCVAEGDAWMLDVEDDLALCLAEGCERQEFNVRENETQFFIEWTSNFEIRDGLFIVIYPDGRVSMRPEYPAADIQERIRKMQPGKVPVQGVADPVWDIGPAVEATNRLRRALEESQKDRH